MKLENENKYKSWAIKKKSWAPKCLSQSNDALKKN